MSRTKTTRSKLAEQAQNLAAANALHLQLQTLTQSGLDEVIKRAFAEIKMSEGGATSRP
jgi:hypothetical protein